MKAIQTAIVSIVLAGSVSLRADQAPADIRALLDCTGKSRSHAEIEAEDLKSLARGAISADLNTAKRSIEKLREKGPAGLQALLDEHAQILNPTSQVFLATGKPAANENLNRLKAALDAVGQQRDCYASKLFWFTDLDEAKAAAKASGKPILSLRLLGKLDEEFSCANSRFFRTTLYANAEISKYLRQHFILHWKSVRPVPRITIDFGDGRKIERTITGNSIHYVLDADGQVIDALPGLYSPKEFLSGLCVADYAAGKASALVGAEREEYLRKYQRGRIAAIETQWANDLDSIGGRQSQPIKILGWATDNLPPSAVLACQTTVTKAGTEVHLLHAIMPRTDVNRAQLESGTEEAAWLKIAALPHHAVYLDGSSRNLIRAKNPDAFDAGRVALTKAVTETPMLRAIRNLERSIAEDTVRNEYLLHTKILDWLASGQTPADVEQLNSKIYAELFLTPDSDPWLGLVPRDTIAGLDNNGIVQSAKQ